jgi:excisionase family DNA binding protein
MSDEGIQTVPEQWLNTQGLARYLHIHEKQVYALLKSGHLPGTKATGKWLFSKRIVDAWLEGQTRQNLSEVRQRSRRSEGALLAAGSDDPLLSMLIAAAGRSVPGVTIFSAVTGSVEGLRALGEGYTDVAWSHLLDAEMGSYNTPAVISRYLGDRETTTVHLFNREVGFVTAAGNPKGIAAFSDLVRPDVRFVNRQEGSGIRLLTEARLRVEGIDPGQIRGVDQPVCTHVEVGLAVLSGKAEVGIAVGALARLLGLCFVPLAEESFDMVLARKTFFSRTIQSLLDILQGEAFQESVRTLGGYDFARTGRIMN